MTEIAIARRVKDHAVELAIELIKARSVGLRVAHFGIDHFHFRKLDLRCSAGGQPGGGGFEHDAHFVEFGHFGIIELADGCARSRHVIDQSVSFETSNGLADRRARDAEPGGEFGFE